MSFWFGQELDVGIVVTINEAFSDLLDQKSEIYDLNNLRIICESLFTMLGTVSFDKTRSSVFGRSFEQLIDIFTTIEKLAEDDQEAQEMYARWRTEVKSLWNLLPANQDAPQTENAIVIEALHIVREFAANLHQVYRDECNTLRAIVPNPRLLTDWEQVEKRIGEDIYTSLPKTARLDFQEGAYCMICERYAGGAMLAMRAAEAVLREYYWRVMGHNTPSEPDNWGRIVDKLEKSETPLSRRLQHCLRNAQDVRNGLAHPDLDSSLLEPVDYIHYFNEAERVCRELFRDLQKRRLVLSVCLPQRSNLDIDLLVATWLLDRDEGIGRLSFAQKMPSIDEHDRIVGFDVQDTLGSAQRLAPQVNVDNWCQRLLDYCQMWLEVQSKRQSVVTSHAAAQTFEGLLGSIWVFHRKETPAEQYQHLIDLLHQMAGKELDPFDDQLATKLPQDYQPYVEYHNATIANERRREFMFGTQKGLVTYAPTNLFDAVSEQFAEQDYAILAFTDENQKFIVKSRGNVDTIFRNLAMKMGKTDDLEFTPDNNWKTIRPKQTVTLSVDELYACISEPK